MNELNERINEDIFKNSYVTKDEFLKIIETLEFIAVEDAELTLITGFKKMDDKINPLSKNIRIS